MNEDRKLKVLIRNQRVVTLEELYEEYNKTHAQEANLSFEEKIKALVVMQEMAVAWGGKQDVIVWKIGN